MQALAGICRLIEEAVHQQAGAADQTGEPRARPHLVPALLR